MPCFSINPRIMITSKPFLNAIGKSQIYYNIKVLSIQVWTLCASTYIGQNSGLLKIRLKEYVSKIIESYISDKEKIMNAPVKNDIKRSSIADGLINDPTSAEKYKFSTFEILNNI